jgi:GT2 family glycosyltransferase
VVSAILVTYDSADCVADCIRSIRKTLPGAQVIVVDNASRDRTTAIARATDESVILVELDENLGFGRACNIGAERAEGAHVLFVNPDARLVDANREALARLTAQRPFGLVAPALTDEPDRLRIEPSWAAELFARTVMMLRPREWRPRTRRSPRGNGWWASGALLLVERAEFLALGGFDPRFFLYFEDRDLCRRYRVAGFAIRTTDALRGTHEGGSSSTEDDLRARPIAWGVLGWLEYVAITRGSVAADRTAAAALLLLRGMRAGTRTLEAAGWTRARRKRLQLDEVLGLLAALAGAPDDGFCPDARAAVRRRS